MSALNDTLDGMDKTDMYGPLHPRISDDTLFSRICGSFSGIDSWFERKKSLTKCKNTEIIPSIFYDHNDLELEKNWKKKRQMENNTNGADSTTCF